MVAAPNQSLYSEQRFLLFTLDPVHIGTGGYRLGRVDMSIVREPGTNLPKVPGTSLAGATRSYAAMRYGKPEAAGQHLSLRRLAAEKKRRCPIIYTFGTATDTGGGQAGTVSLTDARVLFFPVPTLEGSVWASTADLLEEAGFRPSARPGGDDELLTSLPGQRQRLNLGWLLFNTVRPCSVTPPEGTEPGSEWERMRNRVVVATPKLFSHIVNSNLEVRTSVSIDPTTGAAQEGALFTYEAIPRATVLWTDVVVDDYHTSGSRSAQFPRTDRQFKPAPLGDDGEPIGDGEDNAGEPLGEVWTSPLDVVRAGMSLLEYLGVGGMGTRGFGRVRSIADWALA